MNQKNKNEMILSGLSCANCAAIIEDKINDLPWVKEARFNLATQILTLHTEQDDIKSGAMEEIQNLVDRIDDGVTVKERSLKTEKNIPQDDHRILKSLKDRIFEISGALLFFFLLYLRKSQELNVELTVLLFGVAYLLSGRRVLFSALKNIRRGRVLDENFLMVIATVGAFAIKEYPEAVAVMLFYQLGEYFQDLAVDHSRRSIRNLLDSTPEMVLVKHEDRIIETAPEEVSPGCEILVRPGGRIPLDGVVLRGSGSVDTSALTGESYPRKVSAGSAVLSGFVCRESPLEIEVSKNLEESAYSRIIRMVEESSGRKAQSEQFITRFARIYTPAVVFSALLLAVIPPLFLAGAEFSVWIYRALVFLVVSCPCALVVSIPLGFFAGIGTASRHGILIKGGNYLEALNRIDTVVLDKTGTLTKGVFKLTSISSAPSCSDDELLHMAASAETHSTHPIAQSIRQAWNKRSPVVSLPDAESIVEIAGKGIQARLEGKTISLGKHEWIAAICAAEIEDKAGIEGTHIHIALEDKYMGSLILSDELRPDAADAVRTLMNEGIEQVIMLSGDREETASSVARQLGLTSYRANLLPGEKVKALEELVQEGRITAFAGDGINDAPVLARADVGIAMGGLGSDAAIEAADIVLMSDEPFRIVTARRIARLTRKIILENIIMALGIKVAVLGLAAIGMAGMGLAVFADVGVALLAVLNAMRILLFQEK